MSPVLTSAPLAPDAAGPPTWPSLESVLGRPASLPRWMGWRLRALMLIVVLGLAMVLLVASWLSSGPRFPISLKVTPTGEVALQTADYPTLRKLEGQVLERIRIESQDAGGNGLSHVAALEPLALHPSGRWVLDGPGRQRFEALHEALSPLQDSWSSIGVVVQLQLQGGAKETVLIAPRGWSGITPTYWALSLLALMVLGVGAVTVLAGPDARNAAFAVLALAQSGQLMLMGIEANLELFTPLWLLHMDTQARTLFDLLSAAALVHMALLNPAQDRGRAWKASLAWGVAIGVWLSCRQLCHPHSWWVVQLTCTGLGAAAVAVTVHSQHRAPHPLNQVLQRMLIISLLTWVTLTLAMWQGASRPDLNLQLAVHGVATWEVFVTSMVLLSPYFSRARSVMQEFTLLAASGTVAASLDLLFVALFSLGQLTSMTLSLFLSLGLYLSFRRWLLGRLPRPDGVSMEQVFQQLYRIVRQVERQPEALCPAIERLLCDLFDPLEIHLACGDVEQASLRGNGSILLVPMPCRLASGHTAPNVMVLRHARRGQQLFTREDASLAQRIMEQLHRALTFDQAVEQGRSEERMRIAQDLHDDIGARLLTLMYQAPSPEIEEYIRHTIQDLKTLTRGLAAQSHTLGEAAAEWKRDLSHRLGVARCELRWHIHLDNDVNLSMVQWSALTRILRELINNAISHARARHVEVRLVLEQDCLSLSVSDDGVGSEPSSWSHGLGLGGVRKRVKQLGGTVRWLDNEPRGIRCEVVVPHLMGPAVAEGQLSH
ncbi:MAG: histidine kinase [Burkholderiales bacterium]|nr:histidine kinase [Burkholderiales bacterium]MBH2017664.1 histidine kinase [Burkholderiales bacterium]